MKILFGDQEYLDLKLSSKEDSVVITTKTRWDEGSFAMSTVNLNDEQVDKLISELIKVKPRIKNAKV
jgi:hypothetical protein